MGAFYNETLMDEQLFPLQTHTCSLFAASYYSTHSLFYFNDASLDCAFCENKKRNHGLRLYGLQTFYLADHTCERTK